MEAKVFPPKSCQSFKCQISCLEQTTKYCFLQLFTWEQHWQHQVCWLRLDLASSPQSKSTQQRNCFKYSPVKHPESVFKNAMRKQATHIPHFPSLPNLGAILGGRSAFEKSYVIALSSELAEMFFLFQMLTPVSRQQRTQCWMASAIIATGHVLQQTESEQ